MKFNKRILSAILGGVITLTSLSGGVVGATLEQEEIEINQNLADRNVEYSKWSEFYVKMGYHYGLMDGTNLEKNVRLSRVINREDFTEIVMNYLRVHMTEFQMDQIKSKNKVVEFIDTSNKNIEEASQMGLIFGVGEGNFSPYGSISRQEVAVILTRVEKLLDVCDKLSVRPIPELAIFSDRDEISEWAREGVALQVKLGSISGSDGKLNPRDFTTSEESIKMLVELYDKK